MASILDMLSETVRTALAAHVPTTVQLEGVGVQPTTNPRYGDYQCNACMMVAKALGSLKPQELARRVAEDLKDSPLLEKVETAGPGFINLWIKRSWLAQCLSEVYRDERLGVDVPGKGRRVVIDYSSPNVAKPMHIGHLRSTILGNALDRTYRFLGYEVISDNHIGDWGTQFGILLVGFERFADHESFTKHPIEELERVYVTCYQKAKEDPTLMEEARRALVRLQQGDPASRSLWSTFVAGSLEEFNKMYERLGVSFDHTLGESFYNDRLAGVVQDLCTRGLARESEGAIVVFLDDEHLPPCIVRKSDGGFNYATTDIATILYRCERWDPEKIIYVTDERQQLHFRQVFAIARKLGVSVDLEHVWFGLMRLPEGTFSTREGNVIRLERLLDQAEQKAYEVARELNPTLGEHMHREIARKVGIGAVKYADLSQNRHSVVTFTWEKALSLEGNTAPYLQYSYARIQSVLRKYQSEYGNLNGISSSSAVVLTEEEEVALAKRVLEFPHVIAKVATTYRPNVLTDYLFDLASVYNRFYQNIPFLKAPHGIRESRVLMCDLVGKLIQRGLDLLGIEVPDRM